MFRLWCKLFDESNHLMKDMVYANSDIDINRTKKIFDGIKEACYTFDLSEPIWLDSNIAKDNFIDSIDFAYMEVQVIEED